MYIYLYLLLRSLGSTGHPFKFPTWFVSGDSCSGILGRLGIEPGLSIKGPKFGIMGTGFGMTGPEFRLGFGLTESGFGILGIPAPELGISGIPGTANGILGNPVPAVGNLGNPKPEGSCWI